MLNHGLLHVPRGICIPRSDQAVRLPRRLLAKRTDSPPVTLPVGRVVIHDDEEPHALDVESDAPHGAREPIVGAAAQNPRVMSLIAVARPVVPHLGAGLGEVVQDQARLRVEADRAVLLGNAGEAGEKHVAVAGIGPQCENAWAAGTMRKGELDGGLGGAGGRR